MTTILLFTIGFVIALVKSVPIEYYASRYDHLDIETILNNRRMVNYYAACLLSKGPCPPQGLEFKRILPEALRTNCLRCTEKQKTVTYRTIRRLKKEYPKIWEQLAAEWDPDDVFVNKFETTFQNYEKRPSTVIPTIIQTTPAIPLGLFTTPSSSSINPTIASSVQTSIPSQAQSEIPNNDINSVNGLVDRFGDSQESADSNTIIKGPYPASSPSTPAITNKPISTTTLKPIPVTSKRSPTFRPVGVTNLQATVSLGTNVVGSIVRGLGDFGNRVVETGARIANVVLSTVTGCCGARSS